MNAHDESTGVDTFETTEVLVVGAGPAGLVTAIGLARYGVRAMLVERRADMSTFPRATGISVRSMEIMRAWGLEQRVREVGFRALPTGRVGPTLISPEGETVPLGFPTEDDVRRVSPTSFAAVAQDAFEPVLLDEAGSQGADVRLGTELVTIHQHRDGVTAVLRDATTGRRSVVRSRFLVGADGSRSAVRSAMRIAMTGPDHLDEFVSTLFRAPLSEYLGHTPHGLNMIPGPTGMAVMLPTSDDDRWVFAQSWDPSSGRIEEFTAARVAAAIRAASGIPALAVEILSIGAFSFAAQVADAFRSDRVFLVGDAAHRMTPRGGSGMNTAIHDAHNLAWKLAFVLRGWGLPRLLDTYEQERRPVGETNTRRSAEPTDPGLDAIAADVGVCYERGALIPDGAVPFAEGDSWRPTGRPGARLPHLWLERAGERLSTLDLIGPGLTVFTGPDGEHWRYAARAAASTGVSVRVLVVDGNDLVDPSGEFTALYGIDSGGAVIVRPDAHIAWRARSTGGIDVARELRTGISAALGESPRGGEDARGAA